MSDQDAGMPSVMTGMQEAAAMTHEIFITLQQVGFTHDEAFQLVSNLLNIMMVEGFRQNRLADGA